MSLNEFCAYLEDQVGQPYLWGGQHTKLTPDNYVKVIYAAEAGTGGYAGGESYAEAVIKFCKKKFDMGIPVLYAYDCSGLGMYWLYNVKHILPYDMNSQRMSGECIIMAGKPKKGYWVFRFNSSHTKISHIGYMISDTHLIEAKGRRYGVKDTIYRRAEWDLIGIPKCFIEDIQPNIEVIGGYVNIRDRDSKKGNIIKIAKRGELYSFIGIAPSGWYEIFVPDLNRIGYISNRSDLTKFA